MREAKNFYYVPDAVFRGSILFPLCFICFSIIS